MGDHRDRSLNVVTLVLVGVWTVCDVAFGAAGVFAGHLGGQLPSVSALGLMAFVMGLNVLLAAVVIGMIALLRSGELRIVRTVLFVLVLVAGVIGSFAFGGWHTTTPDTVVSVTTQRRDGILVWLIAAIVMAVSVWLFRPARHEPDAGLER